MSNSLLGFLRGLGYSLLYALLVFIATNIGASGLVSLTVSALITAGCAALEHYLTTVDPDLGTIAPQ